MKLTLKLFSSGVLGRGEVRHCSEWDLPSGVSAPRFRSNHPLRQIDRRRTRARGWQPGLFSNQDRRK